MSNEEDPPVFVSIRNAVDRMEKIMLHNNLRVPEQGRRELATEVSEDDDKRLRWFTSWYGANPRPPYGTKPHIVDRGNFNAEAVAAMQWWLKHRSREAATYIDPNAIKSPGGE